MTTYKHELKPGDVFFTQITGILGFFIRFAQLLTGDASRYTHVGILLDDNTVVAAQPGGAEHITLEELMTRQAETGAPFGWSAWELTDETRSAIVKSARKYIGTPYNFLDYLSILLVTLRIRPKRFKERVHNNKKLICSQLVDQVYLEAGIHLFDDGRLSGDVTPGDLAYVGRVYHWNTGPFIDLL